LILLFVYIDYLLLIIIIGIAICPNTEDVLIYSNANDPDFNKWKLEHTLTGHDLVVSGYVYYFYV